MLIVPRPGLFRIPSPPAPYLPPLDSTLSPRDAQSLPTLAPYTNTFALFMFRWFFFVSRPFLCACPVCPNHRQWEQSPRVWSGRHVCAFHTRTIPRASIGRARPWAQARPLPLNLAIAGDYAFCLKLNRNLPIILLRFYVSLRSGFQIMCAGTASRNELPSFPPSFERW